MPFIFKLENGISNALTKLAFVEIEGAQPMQQLQYAQLQYAQDSLHFSMQ